MTQDNVDWTTALDLIVGSPAAEAQRLAAEEQQLAAEPARIQAFGEARIRESFAQIWGEMETAYQSLQAKDIGATISTDASGEWISIAARQHSLRVAIDIQNLSVTASIDGQIETLLFDRALQYLVHQEVEPEIQVNGFEFIDRRLYALLTLISAS